MIKITTIDGKSPEEGLKSKIFDIISRLKADSGKIMQKSLLWTTRNHFKTIYPGSRHYNPDKVTEKSSNVEGEGSIQIDVPGITRNFHDLDIKPRYRKFLTIPIHREAYGKKASEIPGLFMIRKKNDNNRAWLVKKDGENLTYMYRLVKGVHQNQDNRLLPSDDVYRKNIAARLMAYLNQTIQN